jgi:hypothetical protein
MIPEVPSWYDESYNDYNHAYMQSIIKGTTSDVNVDLLAINTVVPISNFKVDAWGGMPPLVLKWYSEPLASGGTSTAVHRACLSPPRFKFTATNGLATAVVLGTVYIYWVWNYRQDNLLMDLRPESGHSDDYSQLYTLPKMSETTGSVTEFPLYGVVKGYRTNEVIKVYAFFDEWVSDGDYYFPTCHVMEAVEETAGSNFPACVWKASGNPVGYEDYMRMSYIGMDNSSEYVKVITPQIIASDEHYRTIEVKLASGYIDTDEDATFEITIKPNNDIDDSITVGELAANIETVRFFDVETPFAETVKVNRSEINPIFYERLNQNYKTSVVLQSVLDEPLYFIEFMVNNYPLFVPIYNGQTLYMSDSQVHCTDGVRSSKMFNFATSIPNVITIQNPTKHKYKVKLNVDYDVYKDVYVVDVNQFV